MYSALWTKNGEQIKPSFISVNANVVDLASQIVFTKTYSNIGAAFEGAASDEATFKAHLNTSLGVLIGFEIQLDGKKIVAEVVNQAEALRQFESSNQGGTVIKEADFAAGSSDPFIQEDFFLCKLNNLAQYRELEVIITYVTEMSMQGEYLYMVFPTSLSTVRSTQYFETLPSHSLANKQDLAASTPGISTEKQGISIRLELEMPSAIVEVKSPSHPEGIEASWKESTGKVVWKDQRQIDVVNQSDLVILVKLKDPHEPAGFIERNQDGSRALMIVFYPKLAGENRIVSDSELIFLVDCSESMEGYNMQHAKKGLHLFSHSLPKGTLFNIISFGSTHHKLFPESRPYDEQNLAAATQYIKLLKPEAGETNLLAPLQDIYATPTTRPRKLFLLTDGRVSNTGPIAELVRQNAHNTSVFPIGMGDFVSRQLVDVIASAGCGVAELAIENETIEGKVVRQLRRALQPAFTNIRIDWGEMSSVKQSPRDLRTLFDGDRLTVFNILQKDEKVTGTVKLLANGPNGPVSFQVQIKGDEFKQGDVLHCLAAYTLIQDLQAQLIDSTDSQECDRLRKRIVELGIKYRLATNYTSFLSVEEGGALAKKEQSTPLESSMISLRGSASGIPTNHSAAGHHHHFTASASSAHNINNNNNNAINNNTTPAPLKPSSPPFTPSTISPLSSTAAPFTPSALSRSALRFDSPEFVPRKAPTATSIPFSLPTTTSPLKPAVVAPAVVAPAVVAPAVVAPAVVAPAVVTPVVAAEPVKVVEVAPVVVAAPVEPTPTPAPVAAVPAPVVAETKEVVAAPVVAAEPVKAVEPVVATPTPVVAAAPVVAATPVVAAAVTPAVVAPAVVAATPAPVAATPAAAPAVVANRPLASSTNVGSTSPPAKIVWQSDFLMSQRSSPSSNRMPEALKPYTQLIAPNQGKQGIFASGNNNRAKARDHGRNYQNNNNNANKPPPTVPKKLTSKDTEGEYGETYKKFKFNLNRITMDTYEKLVKTIEEIVVPNVEVLQGIAKILFEKAIIDQKYSAVYAILTGQLDVKYPKFVDVTIKRLVITLCQTEFEPSQAKLDADKARLEPLAKEDRDEEEFIIKRRTLGNIKFIGELYKHSVLPEKIVVVVLEKMLSTSISTLNEERVEGMVKFLTTVGKRLDIDPAKNHNTFIRIQQLSENQGLTSRGRYLLLDILDLRANRWEPKNSTILKVNKEENEKEERFIAKHGRRDGGSRDSRDNRDNRDNNRNDRDDRRGSRDDRGHGGGNNRDNDRTPRKGIFGKSKDGWETVGAKGSPKKPSTPMKKGDLNTSSGSLPTPGKNAQSPLRTSTNSTANLKKDNSRNMFNLLDEDEDHDDMPSPSVSNNNKKDSSAAAPAAEATITTEKLEDTIGMTLDEYLESRDVDEAIECFKELNYPSLYSKIICIIVSKSFEKKDKEKVAIIELFESLVQLYSPEIIKEGIKEVLDMIEDVEIDLPFASKFLAELIGMFVEIEVFPLNYLEEAYIQLVDTGMAEEMLRYSFKAIEKHSDSDRLTELYENCSNLDILKLFRPKNRTTQYLQEEFFQEHFPNMSLANKAVTDQSAEPSLVEHLILLQKAEGNWELTKTLAGVLNVPLSDLEKTENSDSVATTHPNIWATCLAYSFIQINFTEEQEDLELIKHKIFVWLKSEYDSPDAPKQSLDDILKKAKRLISEY
eukprot:gene15038-17790_t